MSWPASRISSPRVNGNGLKIIPDVWQRFHDNPAPPERRHLLHSPHAVTTGVEVPVKDLKEQPAAEEVSGNTNTNQQQSAPPEAQTVLKLFEGRLARFKHPRKVIWVETLPRNAMGKVLKHEVRDLIADLVRDD